MTDAFPPNAWSRQDANQVVESIQQAAYQAGLDAGTTRLDSVRKQVQFLRDGADSAYQRMLNPDGSESVYAPEHRHFREAYQSVLDIIDAAADADGSTS